MSIKGLTQINMDTKIRNTSVIIVSLLRDIVQIFILLKKKANLFHGSLNMILWASSSISAVVLPSTTGVETIMRDIGASTKWNVDYDRAIRDVLFVLLNWLFGSPASLDARRRPAAVWCESSGDDGRRRRRGAWANVRHQLIVVGTRPSTHTNALRILNVPSCRNYTQISI